MKRLTPFRSHVPFASSQWAFSITACKSLPASGSVRSIAQVSPRDTRGRYLALSSSDANSFSVSGAVLQAPDVLETGVGACDHLIRHHEIDEREVQPLVLARQRQPEQAGLTQRLDIASRARSVLHVIVHDLGTVVIDSLGVRSDHVAAHFADDFHHAAVAVLSVLEIDRRVVVRVLVGISFLLELHDLLHQRMIHVELEILCVQKEISHSVYRILYRYGRGRYFEFCL